MSRTKARSLHWSEQREAAFGYWQVRLLLILFRIIPVFLMKLCAFPVSLGYYICAGKARGESRNFLKRAFAAQGKGTLCLNPLKHFLAFSLTVIEKLEAWGGKVPFERIHFQGEDIKDLIATLEQREGAVLICSHLGNAELLRGLAGFNRTGVSREVPVTSIVNFSVTLHFNRMIRELNPDSTLRIISTGDIGPDTVILLQERIAQGELVVIAGDRTSEHTRNNYFLFPFLSEPAPFGYGAFFLAALLNAPVYFVFALRRGDISLWSDYTMYVHKSPLSFNCSRKEREKRIEELARNFAALLEGYCKEHPYQWYNFYDFWAKPEGFIRSLAPEKE